MADEKLPDIIPLGGPIPPADEYEPIIDNDSGVTVYRPRKMRATPPAVKGDSNVMGWRDGSGHQLARSWYEETRDDLIGEVQGARSVIRNLSSLKPLSPEEENELVELKGRPMLPSGLFASGPYHPPQQSFTPEFTRRTELERRKNAPQLIATVKEGLNKKLDELEETFATLQLYQGTTQGMKDFEGAKGFMSTLKAFANAPLDSTTGLVFENAVASGKAAGAAAAATAATALTGGGALVPIIGVGVGAGVGGVETYDSELAKKLAQNPEFAKNPRAFLANLDKTVASAEQEKDFQAQRDNAIGAGLTETLVTAATGGLTKLLPQGTTPVRKFLWDGLGEVIEENLVGDAESLRQNGKLMSLADRFRTTVSTVGQTGMTHGGGVLASKAGEVSGVSKLVSDAFKPQLQVDQTTLTPMAPRPFSLMPPTAAPQIAVDLNTLTPIAAPVDPAQLQINPASLTPVDPAPASLPNVIPLPGPSASAPAAQAGTTQLPDIIPLSGPTSTAQEPIAASRGDQPAPQAQGEARPQIPFAPQSQAPQANPLAPAQPAQGAPASAPQADATAPQATGSQAQPGVSSLFTPPPAQPSQRQANPLAPVSTGAEQLAGGDAGESARNNVVPREAMQAPRKGNRFVEVDPRLVNDEHERTSDMSVRDPKNVVSRGGKSRIEHAKDYIRAGVFDGSAPGGKAEAAEIGFGEPGKLAIVNGRHRLVASEQLGAPSVTVQVPEADADEIARRFAPRPQATQATAQPAAPQGASPAPAQPGRAPISLAPVSNAVTNPEVGRQRPKLSVRDEAAWTELERKAAELDRRRDARSQAQDRNTDPSTRRRGPEQIAQRLINELRKGGSLTHQEATAALRVTEILMERGYMDNLAVSVSNVEKGGGVRGEYNPVTELVKMFVRNTNRPGIFKRTFAHEVSHHLERMVPAKDLEAARQQFLRERAQWLKDKGGLRQLLGEGNWLDKSFTNAQIKQFLGGNTMDPSLISKYFIKDTNTGKWRLKLTDETYKFTNFSEYFAERVSEIAGERDDARLNPQDGPRVWAKIKDMLAQLKKALIDVFGKDKVEAIWDKFQDGEYTSDFKRDKLAGYDRTGGQNPIMDDPRTADYRASRFGPADADRQTRVDNIDKLEPNKAFSAEDQSKIDDMRFAGESILDESAGQADDTIAARRDEQVSMASVEKDAKKSGKIAGATLYISSRMLEGTSFDDAFGEVVSKYGNSFSKFREVIQQTTERIAGLPVSEAFDEAEKLASTRYPMAVGALEDPNKRNLISGLATILADPEKTKKSARELRKVTGFKSDKSWDDQRVIREFIKHVEGNLDWLYKGMRDRLPKGILERSKLWYVGANAIANRLAKKHSIPVEAAAGVLAVLSPQMDWYKNVSLAERALEIVVNKKNHVVDNAMVEAILKRPSMVKLFMAIHEANIYGEEFDQKKTKWPNKGDFTRDSKAAKALQEKLMAEALPILRKSGVIPVGTKMGDVKDARLYAYLLRAYDEAYNPREYAVITPEGGTAGMSMNEENTKMNDIGWGNFDIIEKVRPLVENPTMENISRLMGGEHKVRNFYNNIIDPNAELGQVTIDTHAVAAALLEPLAGSDKEVEDNLGETGGSDYTGLSGLYPIYAQAYQNAAKKYGLLPREMQSITWEGVRGLFTNKFKNATNKATIKGHWADYAAGKISLSEVRSKIEKTAGGFKPPTWYGRDGQSPEGLGSTQDQGAVDPRGVREGRGRPGPGRAGKGPKGPSVRSARDDGENTPIPGGYREAFFQAKKGAGAAEPKQIKFWTDLGHDFDADPSKQFLWAIDKTGKMSVVSVSDLRDVLHEYGYENRDGQDSESDSLTNRNYSKHEGVTHLDWESLAHFGEMDDTPVEGVTYDLLKGPAHGRIDATGDVVRISMVQKNQSDPAMKADMRDYVKGKLAESMGIEPDQARGYDFTDAGPFNGPEVFSARDEENDPALKPLEVDQSSPSGKVSIPGSMGFRFGALAMGEQGRPGTIRYFHMNGVTAAETQIALYEAKSTEEKANVVGKLPHADVRISPDGRYAEIEWIQTPEGVQKLGIGGDFARRVMFDLRNRNVEEISFRAINPGSMKILLRGMKNSLAGKQEDFRVTSLEDARDVMDGDQTEYAYDVVISRVGTDSGEGYALDTALDRALTNGRGSEDIKRQLSLANNPGENYFPGQKGAVPSDKGMNADWLQSGAPNVRQLAGQSGEEYFGRIKMKPGYKIGSDNKVIRSGDDAPHWLDIGHDNRTVESDADGFEHIGMPEIWATDAKSGKMRFFAATFTDDTHEALLGGSQGLSESRYGERGRIDHAIIDTKGNLIARGRISLNGTISQKPDPARIKKIKEAIAARAVDEDGNRIKVSYSDYDVFWYGNNDDYKAANNLSVDDYGPGIYSARDESTNEGDRDDAIPTSKSGVISDKDGKPVELYRGQYGRGVGRAIQTKSGSITFSNEIEDARLYAKEPNNYDDTAEEPKILRANLTIKNPWINSGFDHSITFNDILRGVGGDKAKAMHFMRKHAETFENSGVWEEEINPDGKYKSAKDFFTKHPERINELLGMAFVLLDDPMFIEQLKINDFDGAIHGAYGAGVGTEFKVFDADQVTLTSDEVASARDEDGENTVIPGGNREAFFNMKAGVPEPKRIKYYTDIGHPTEGQDKNKFFLWALDDRGKLRVRSVAEVEQMVKETGKDPEAFFSDEDEVVHGDWFHNSGETGKDGHLRDSNSMGRIDASGDVIRVSYATRGAYGESAEIDVEDRDNTKRLLADYLRKPPGDIRGYDFTKTMETGEDPTVFSARDEDPAPRKLKADPVVRNPDDAREARYPKGKDLVLKDYNGEDDITNLLGRDDLSPERKKQLRNFVKDSVVKRVLYRGQDGAYEVADPELAEDGMMHLAADPSYAAGYAGSDGSKVSSDGSKEAVVEVYLNVQNVIDLSKVGHSIYDMKKIEGMRDNEDSPDPGMDANDAIFDREKEIVDKLLSEIRRIKGPDVDLTDVNERLLDAIAEVSNEGNGIFTSGAVWQLFKHSVISDIFADYDIHAIKYSDSGMSTATGTHRGGQVSYAVMDPARIKAAFGDNDVNPDSDNIFQSRRDEDVPSTGSTARKAGLAAGALALAPTTVEAATGAAKTGALIAGVAAGDLIAVATGIAFTSSDRLLKGLNPIAANMHLLANDTKSPTMKRIAEMFNRLGGNTSAGAQETYHEERDANRRVYRNKLAKAFEPLAKLSQAQIRALDITIARALAGEIPMPAGPVGQVVQNLQALSDELYRYLREAGIDVNYAKDYAIPHSFNAELVAKDEQAFIDLAEQAYIDNNPKRIQRLLAYIQQIDQEAAQNGGFTQEMTERKDALNVEINKLQGANPRQQAEDLAAAILAGEEGGDQSQGLILASNPRNQNRSDFLKDRVFEQSARGMLREYFQNDPRHAWNNYIARATTLAEFARRFGSKGETWNQLVADMRAEKVKEVDITRIKEHVLDAMGALTPAAQGSHAMANALVGLSNMSKLKSTFLTNFLEAQAQAIPGNLLDAAFAPVVMLREFAAVLVELSPRQRALLKQYLRMDLNTETGNMELARIVGLMDSAGVHNIMENSAYALENKADFREDSRTDRAARAVSRATGAMAQAYGIEASENAKRAMGARYASGRLDQHVSEFLRDNILARALKKVGYTGDVFTTRNEAIMRLRRAGINDNNMAAFGAWWEKAKASGNFNELLADTTDPMAALARKAIRMESARAMVNSNRAMKPGGVRNKAISQDNFFGKIVMSFLNYPAAFREQVAKPMARDIATGVRGYESEGGQATFFSPAERARMVARVAAIPAMAISAAVFLALRVLALGDEEDKEELKKKTLLSHMIDGVSYTGLTGGKTEAVQRARRGQLPPLIDEGVRLAKNLDRESTNANGKERAVTKSVTRSVAVPVTQAVVSRYAPMPIAAAVDQVLASKTFNEAVVDTVAGPKAEKKKSGGSGRDTGREGSGRSGGRPDGR